MRQHENVTTTEDIANSTRGTADETRTGTDPIDSDRVDADRVESERTDFDSTDADRTDADRTDFDGTDSGRADSGHLGSGRTEAEAEDRLYGQDEPGDDRITEVDETAQPADTTLTGQKQPTDRTDAAADVLFDEADATRFRTRWSEVQTGFVDDPKQAVQQADELVAAVISALATTFAEHKSELEAQWRQGEPATEELRIALRRYRSFFDQLLPS